MIGGKGRHERAMALMIVAAVAGLSAGTAGLAAAPRPRAPVDDARRPEVRAAQGRPARDDFDVPATLGTAYGPAAADSPVYPRQTIPLRFDHDRHVRGVGLACVRCHRKAPTSRTPADDLLPSGRICDECHGSDHALGAGPKAAGQPACSACHVGATQASIRAVVDLPTPLLHFDHAAHLARGATCETCHGTMQGVRLATTLQLPREGTCLGCHDGLSAPSECGVCHPTRSDGRLVVRARDERTLPVLVPRGRSTWGMAHDLAFVRDHRAVAKARPDGCRTCHDEPFCIDCHAGAVRPMRIHAPSYLTTHAVDATAKTMDCAACHASQTFCLGCHERLGFGGRASGPFGIGGGGRVHPEAGWVGPKGAGQGHAFEAQRNLAACASCHTEDSCLACHATTGAKAPGIDADPHGPGFAGSSRCLALEARSRRTCLTCHAPGDPNLACLGG
ncbi:MAG: hypothetical protein D6705_04140 [Deltaproteobacteria bacterium]|nr:MAG: hypothetical protein D6705_04140 [Deltaproteobacteria bacterium]